MIIMIIIYMKVRSVTRMIAPGDENNLNFHLID